MIALPLRNERATEDASRATLYVLNVQRTCVHDGPGIRTTVFFRGCNMRCRWCHNPEAQAHVRTPTADVAYSVRDILEIVLRDQAYYASSHGGVTLSGGEPLLQPPDGLVSLLAELKRANIHVAVETAADAPWRAFETALPFVDLFLVDLKAATDDDLHRRLTARDRRRVESNVRRLVATRVPVRFRMCVVPGYNDAGDNLAATASFLHSVGQPAIELLRYYNLHERKTRRAGVDQKPLHISTERSAAALARAAAVLTELGIAVRHCAPNAPRATATFPARVHRLKEAIRRSGRHVCLESAILKTDFYKAHGFAAPVGPQRAQLLRHLLNNKTVIVYPDELLVGNFTSKRVGGNVWVEYFGTGMLMNLWRIDRQKPVPFRCSTADKLRFYTQLLPFWARHGLVAQTFPSLAELVRFLARTLELRAGFNNNMAAIAHYIVNGERMLRLGTRGIAAEIDAQQSGGHGHRQDFHAGVLIALQALEELADRYATELRGLARRERHADRRAELERMADACSHAPKHPARTFHEALQAILLLQIALCTESFENAISLGRLDQILYPYYQADVAAGRIDYERAKELVACFMLKFDEIVLLNDGDTGLELGKLFESLSPVETVTVGGVDGEGRDCTNDVSRMILDVCELHPIGVNMAARIWRDSPREYVERIAELYLSGSPMPALFNDDVYVPALQRRHPTPLREARNYSIVGCVEPVASTEHFANTDCANVNVILPFLQALKGEERPLWKHGAFDRLDRRRLRFGRAPKRRHGLGGNGETSPSSRPPASLEELMTRFQARLDDVVQAILADHQRIERALARNFPTPLASALFASAIVSGKDVYEGGAALNSSGIQGVGITDVADSLLALEEVVFTRKRYAIEEVLAAMDADFAGERNQEIRAALLASPKFGDDGAARAPHWVNRVLHAYVTALDRARHPSRNGRYVAGYYGLNVNNVYGRKTPSLPSGRLRGTPLAHSVCPHHGMQMVDLTSALNAVAKVDFASFAPNGTTLTSTIDAGLFPGEEGVRNLAGVIRGYFRQGGMQFQPNLVSREILLDAYDHPGKYKDLVVRIAGYCGYFDDLSDELKLEIINRSYYGATA